MPRPPAISGFKYCPECDLYKRKERDFKGSSAKCNQCLAPSRNYVQKRHVEAVATLGNACMDCGREYVEGKRIVHMMRIPDSPNPLSTDVSQYRRDKEIIANPEWAAKHYRMLCTDCKPKFERLEVDN